MKKAVVNRIINEKGECLFLLRATKPFGLCLVGGKVDEGETELQACIRETNEESGLAIEENQMKLIGQSVSFDGTPVTVFETVLSHTPEITVSPREHLRHRWIKTHSFEFERCYTNEVRQLSFAGNTLKFIDLGIPYFTPEL